MIDNMLVVDAVVHPWNISPGNRNPEAPDTQLDGMRAVEVRQTADKPGTPDRIREHKLDFHPSRH